MLGNYSIQLRNYKTLRNTANCCKFLSDVISKKNIVSFFRSLQKNDVCSNSLPRNDPEQLKKLNSLQ